jgi:TonB family protein
MFPAARLSLLVALVSMVAPLSSFAAGPVARPRVPAGLLLEAPIPEYPDRAREKHMHANGAYFLRVNITTGRVTQVLIAQSTGNAWLEDAAVKALRKWRFKPSALVHHDVRNPRFKPPIAKDECLFMVPVSF